METVTDFIFLGSKITADGDCSHEIKRHSLEKSYDKHRQHIKKQRHYFVDRSPSSQSYGFSSSHVWMWELDHTEGWMLKNWCFCIVVWRRLLRVPWTARRSNQSISDTALQGDKTQIHPTEHRHCLCAWKPGNLHKVLVQSHTLGTVSTSKRNYDLAAWGRRPPTQ